VEGLCGATLDRYRVERWLGGGGFGAVYRANHTVMDRAVALKVLHAQMRTKPKAVTRFFGEAKAATAIGHPGIVQVFDAGTTAEGHAFLAMELVDGCSLKDLAEVGPLTPARAIRIALAVLEALAAAHEAGIVHRDVKPGNIMLGGTSPDGSRSGDDVRLVDFGVSKVRQTKAPEEVTRSGMAMGSPGYASPEQYVSAKTADARSDIYGLSVVLYQLLAGALPFDAESYEQMVVQVCTRDPAPLSKAVPTIPPKLSMIVDRGLRRDPDKRWQRAEDMIAALTPWLSRLAGATAPTQVAPSKPPPGIESYKSHQHTPTFIEAEPDDPEEAVDTASSERPVTAAIAATPAPRRRTALVAVMALLLVGAVAALFVFLSSRDGAPDSAAVGSPPAVAEPPPPTEPAVPVPIPDIPPIAPAVTPTRVDPPRAVDEPVTTTAMMRRRGRRGRMVNPAMTVEMAQEAPQGMMEGRRFGFEDIEPFDPD